MSDGSQSRERIQRHGILMEMKVKTESLQVRRRMYSTGGKKKKRILCVTGSLSKMEEKFLIKQKNECLAEIHYYIHSKAGCELFENVTEILRALPLTSSLQAVDSCIAPRRP